MTHEVASGGAEAPEEARGTQAALPPCALKADDLDTIRKSVEDAAAVSGALWLSYLFVLFYLAVAAGAVSHVDLFLENAVKLPFLGIELPIKAFFLLAPLIFVACHVYTLTYFVMLSEKAIRYNFELRRQIAVDATDPSSEASHLARDLRNRLRRQLPSNIFVQSLAGPDEIRASALGLLLKLIALVSLVVAPILLLLLMQMQFLPYHSAFITWTTRIALLFDVVMILWLWPAILRGRGEVKRRRTWLSATMSVLSALLYGLVVIFSWTIATFPGEPLHNLVWWRGFKTIDRDRTIHVSLHDYLFQGPIDSVLRRRSRFFSSTLVLPVFSVADQLKVKEPEKRAPFTYAFRARGRDLRGAVFDLSDLSHVDFEGSNLRDASLVRTMLRNASLLCAKLQNADLAHASLQGAWFYAADLQGAAMQDAQGKGAMFDGAQMQGASLDRAELQGASFTSANVVAATLSHAHLEGASFTRSDPEAGCIKREDRNRLDQRGADLQAADFYGAALDGASFVGAQLQGADLDKATVDGTDFSAAFLWRADLSGLKDAEGQTKAANVRWRPSRGESSLVAWSDEAFHALAGTLSGLSPRKDVNVPDRDGDDAMNEDDESDWARRLAVLQCSGMSASRPSCDARDPPPDTAALIEKWKQDTADVAAYEASLGATLRKLICSGDADAIYILRGLLGTDRLSDAGPAARGIVDDIQAESSNCPVFRNLLDFDKANLFRFKTTLAARANGK